MKRWEETNEGGEWSISLSNNSRNWLWPLRSVTHTVYQETLQMSVTTCVPWANETTFYANNRTPLNPSPSSSFWTSFTFSKLTPIICGKGSAHPPTLYVVSRFFFTLKLMQAVDMCNWKWWRQKNNLTCQQPHICYIYSKASALLPEWERDTLVYRLYLIYNQ